jgi:LysM repeat protein
MKEDPEIEIADDWSDDSISSRMRGRGGSGKSKLFRISLAIILVLIFAGGILYFLTKRPTPREASPLQLKLAALEQKISGLEKQLTELQGKTGASGPDPALLQRVDVLTQKVEALEKQKRPTVESKAKPTSPPPKPAASTEKQYHTVQKGETLFRIAKQYGISTAELRKLNNLSPDQPLRAGQKLLVSP